MSLFTDIQDFHKKFDLVYDGNARHLPPDLIEFRRRFLGEELDEYNESSDLTTVELEAGDKDSEQHREAVTGYLSDQLDALVDLVYVALGTAYLQGFDFDEAWRRVHAANMAKKKAEPDGSDSKRGSPHDVVKPEGWVAPDLTDLVSTNEHFPLP